jgi:hypothetical protein
MMVGRPKKDENTRARSQLNLTISSASLGLAFGCLSACLHVPCDIVKILSRPKSSQLVRVPAYHKSAQAFDGKCRKVDGVL